MGLKKCIRESREEKRMFAMRIRKSKCETRLAAFGDLVVCRYIFGKRM